MTTPAQPTGMNELRELDRILDSFYLGDEDKYTPEAWEKHRANAVAAIQQLVERCIPPKQDEHPIDPETGAAVEVYGYEATHNEAIGQFRHNLQQAGLLKIMDEHNDKV